MSENPFTDGQQFSAARLNSMYNAHQNEGVLNGLDASTSTNAFDVDVASGELFLNDDVVSVGSATLSLSTSDPEDRIDLISADSTGLTVTQGNPAATSGQPIAPDIPSGDVLVSLIYVRGGSSEILTGDIFNDYRVELQSISPALIDQSLPGDLDESFFNHSGLANIQRDSHHTPVVFEYYTSPNYIDTGSGGTGSTTTFTVTGTPNGAEFINNISVSVTYSAPNNADGTLDEIEIFNEETGSYETIDTPNDVIDIDLGGGTQTFNNSYSFSPDKFVTNIRLTITMTRVDENVSVDVAASANVRTAVFE